MKRSLVILFSLMLVLPFISAIEFDIKDSYAQGETMIAKFSGNFINGVSKEDIFFYEDYVRVPIQYDLIKIEDEYYIYALLPEQKKTYTLSIEGVTYYQGSKIVEEDIQKNFSTTFEVADFSLKPGAVATSESFSLNVQNLQDSKITIGVGYDEKETSFILNSGEKKSINFKVENVILDNLKYIQLSSSKTKYSVPVFVFAGRQSKSSDEKGLKFEITNSNISMSTNFEKKKIIYLKNLGEEDVKNLSLSLTDELNAYINLSIKEISNLKGNSSKQIELVIKSGEQEKLISGEIKAKIGNKTYAINEIYLNFIKDFVPGNDTEDEGDLILTKTCDELGGKICSEDENCDGETADSFEGDCCLTEKCVAKEEGSTGKIIGWSLVIIILIAVIWFFLRKYNKAKGPLTILEKVRGK